MKLDVNTSASIQLTAKLENLHRSAFPSAVRNTLNDAAFKAKNLIPEVAGGEFTVRQKNLFKSFSGVEKARGFNVNNMTSKVGLIEKSQATELVDGLAKQETGGMVDGRKLIPHDKGRVSSSYTKKLKTKNRFANIRIGTPRNRIKGAKYIMIKKSGSKGTVFNVQGGRLTPVFVYRPTKKSRLKPRPFVAPSALMASKLMEAFYKKNADFQFRKILK